MSVEERNASWTGTPREFWQLDTRSSSARLWQVWVVDATISYRWGQVGGAMQVASETCLGVNLGKSNEVPPPIHAMQQALRYITKKTREGYREYLNGTPLDPAEENVIDFDNLPQNLCFYKPDNSLSPALLKKAEAGKVWYARKRNGLAYILARGSGPTQMYSRRMFKQHDDEVGTSLTWNDRFGHITRAADLVLPTNSILLGELVMDRATADDFAHVQSITKSLTPQSLADQLAHGMPSFYIWDVAFYGGENLVCTKPVRERYALAHSIVTSFNTARSNFNFSGWELLPVVSYEATELASPKDAEARALDAKWEGFVVVDPDGIYGDKGFNFKGKPDRPAAFCGKLKPQMEDDFIAIWDPDNVRGTGLPHRGEVSTKGRYNGGIKCVALYQLNSKGEYVYISNVSSGMTEEMKRDWAKPELFPQVWRVSYKGRRYMSQGDDSNALDFAAFEEARTDKLVVECINPLL